MKISEKEAQKLCNCVEYRLVQDSLSPNIEQLSLNKVQTRIRNCEKAVEYWVARYQSMKEEFAILEKSGKPVPILPAIKMDNHRRKSIVFQQALDRFNKQANILDKSNGRLHSKLRKESK